MRVEMLAWFVCELKSSYGRGWILCRRLEWERSTVSSRVALLLRSAEVKLLFYRFVQHHVECFFLSLFIFYFIPWLYFRAGSVELGSGEGMHSKKMAGRCTDLCKKKKKKSKVATFFLFFFFPWLHFRAGSVELGSGDGHAEKIPEQRVQEKKKKVKNHSTQDSRVVPHRGTN